MALYNKTWGQLSDEDKDLSGRVLGSMTILRLSETPPDDGYDKWVVKCKCGKESVKDGRNLRLGTQKSCGQLCPYRPRGRKK